MKTYAIIICFLTLACLGNGQTNIYHPLPLSDAVWREHQGTYLCSCKDYQNFTSGDTIINGEAYTKIIRSGVNYWQNPQGFCTFQITNYFGEYVGAVRNDSLNKKVYIIPVDSISEKLLYDFDLNNILDTIPPNILTEDNIAFWIMDIDSILIGDDYHRRIKYCPIDQILFDYGCLIEGIGSEFGLFGNWTGGLYGTLGYNYECGSYLICFKQSNQTTYPDTNFQCNTVITGFQNSIEPSGFIISPNPVRNYAIIDFPAELNNIQALINDIYGNEIERVNSLHPSDIIDLRTFREGLYFITLLKCNQPIFRTKIIKIN